MIKFTPREILNGDVKIPEDCIEFFGMTPEQYFHQYDEEFKLLPTGKFAYGDWAAYCSRKYNLLPYPTNEADVLKVYGSKEYSMLHISFIGNEFFKWCRDRLPVLYSTDDSLNINGMFRALDYFDDAKQVKMLEVGCGSGNYSLPLWMNGIDLTLSDVHSVYSEYLMHLVKKYKMPDLQWIDSSLQADFGVNKYDYILCSECIEHTIEPLVYLKKLYDALKPSGIAYISITLGGWTEMDRLHLKKNNDRYSDTILNEQAKIGFRKADCVYQKRPHPIIAQDLLYTHLWTK